MHLHHISIKTKRLNILYDFYMSYFCSSIEHTFLNALGECYGYMLNFKGDGVLELLKMNNDVNHCEVTKKNYHFCVRVKNLDNFLKKLPKKYLYSEPKIGRTDFIYQAMIVDPDGNLIEVHEA